jgi:hypothetical protein
VVYAVVVAEVAVAKVMVVGVEVAVLFCHVE